MTKDEILASADAVRAECSAEMATDPAIAYALTSKGVMPAQDILRWKEERDERVASEAWRAAHPAEVAMEAARDAEIRASILAVIPPLRTGFTVK